jgi:uncharacterized protein
MRIVTALNSTADRLSSLRHGAWHRRDRERPTAAEASRPGANRAGLMHMCWQDLAFFHWPVDPAPIQRRLPGRLRLDTFQGDAWIGVTPFRMTQVRPAFLPTMPGLSTFPELNVRTYVIADGFPGIWFFSLDAAQSIAVCAARKLLNLPYRYARASIESTSAGVQWRSERGGCQSRATFRAVYRPTGDVYTSQPGHLDHWLTERYCLYATTHGGRLFRLSISHRQWPLQPAAADIFENTMFEVNDLPPASAPPLVHFARELDVWGHRPELV